MNHGAPCGDSSPDKRLRCAEQYLFRDAAALERRRRCGLHRRQGKEAVPARRILPSEARTCGAGLP